MTQQPQTKTKAGIIPVAPEAAELISAWQIVISGIVTGGIGWCAAYFPANVPVVRSLLIVGLAGLALSGCAVLQPAVDRSADAIATGIDYACGAAEGPLSDEARIGLIDAINERTTVGNHTATDCDSDGEPDFRIGPDGKVVRPAAP